ILRGVRQQQDEPGRFSICSRQAAVVHRLYVARIDALMCGELTKISALPHTGDLQVFIISEKCRTVEARARSVLRVLERATENIESRITGRVTFH
ncbi:hypothetical protein, partial [Escherichia coli]|uniref:hypothetical protein n=1 Tax=Escherichia coli TaxID=562 RepID=UPI001FF65201